MRPFICVDGVFSKTIHDYVVLNATGIDSASWQAARGGIEAGRGDRDVYVSGVPGLAAAVSARDGGVSGPGD
jgi:hypothetical protein